MWQYKGTILSRTIVCVMYDYIDKQTTAYGVFVDSRPLIYRIIGWSVSDFFSARPRDDVTLSLDHAFNMFFG